MINYTLDVKGVDGSYYATLSAGGETVAEQGDFRKLRQAQDWARTAAARHRDSLRQSVVELHTESFSL